MICRSESFGLPKLFSIVCMPFVLISPTGASTSNFEKSMPDRKDMAASPCSIRFSLTLTIVSFIGSISLLVATIVGTQVNSVFTLRGRGHKRQACFSTSSR